MTNPSHVCESCAGRPFSGLLPDGEGYMDMCPDCRGKGGYFCADPLCPLCDAIREELGLFRMEGHNAQTLAVNAVAKRYKLTVREARELLEDALEVRP